MRTPPAILLLVVLAVTCAFTAPLAPPRPVLDTDFADPFILPTGAGLIAYATNTDRGGRRLNVQWSRSDDGLHWSRPAEAMPRQPRWARARDPDVWAPEVLRVGARYVLYFSARHATLRRPDGLTLCIGTATADRPEGPFVAQDRPLACDAPHGVIDASPLAEGGRLWLYRKTDGNCCHTATRVLAQLLSSDGLRLEGAPVPLGVTNDQAWEGGVIEAPEMRTHAGGWYLFFAGGDYARSDYAIGYARCVGPRGPCTQALDNPLLASRAGLIGPGHQSVFDWRGRSWLAFAAWRAGPPRYRAMYLVPLDWVDGRPVVAGAP